MTQLCDPLVSRTLRFGCVVLALGFAACSGGGGGSKTATNQPGRVADKPGGGFFFTEQNQAGNAQEVRIVRQAYGRLAEVFGLDAFGQRIPMASDWVIEPGLISDGQNYVVETNPLTSQETLVILRDVSDTTKNGGLDQFYQLLFAAEDQLTPIHSADANGAGLYSMVPRNSAVVVQFDDLIDDRTLTAITFRVRTGTPPVLPYEGRVFVDGNHGDLAEHDGKDGAEFYSTRVIVDTTVSEIESFAHDPPLPINGVGLPAAVDVNLANVEVRIPTQINLGVGQNKLLRNPSGHPLTTNSNGPVDFNSPTDDVVRAARSGGSGNLTGDPFNGFLPDKVPPLVVGQQPVGIIDAPDSVDGKLIFRLPTVGFVQPDCAQTPDVGDVLAQTGIVAEIIQKPAPVQGGILKDVLVRLLLYPPVWDDPGLAGPLEWEHSGIGEAEYRSPFDKIQDAGLAPCYVRIAPTPAGPGPGAGLSTQANFNVRFSEPMDPSSLTAFDSLTLTRKAVPDEDEDPLNTSDYVVGTVGLSLNLQEFSMLPDLPMAHLQGQAESYWFSVTGGKFAPTDLAGNPLAGGLPNVEVTIDPDEPQELNGGRVSRFTSVDEEPPIGDAETGSKPEWSGQHLYDLQRETLRPRPVVHFLSTADRSKPLPKLMTPFPKGVQTPLSGLGSKMQMLWRYVDFGFGLTDPSNHNLDVEGLYWSPAAGAVIVDSYSDFEIQIAHSKWAPDEYIDPSSLFPLYQKSGLNLKFDTNFLDKKNDPPKKVHPRPLGYQVNPGDLTIDEVSGTKLMPYPWNRGAAGPEDWTTWTWRNTALRKRAGKDCGGVDPLQLAKALGVAQSCNFYYIGGKNGNIRTIGLPMLMEFRCYPDDGAIGANAFDISLAANSSSMPYFRAFSTGGVNQDGQTIIRDPDTEDEANGGFNPGGGGSKTHGLDNSFYIGAADFVVRISRSHSLWFPATNPFDPEAQPFTDPLYIEPVIEPRPETQPTGTSVSLAFRGAKNMKAEFENNCGEFTYKIPGPGEALHDWMASALKLDSYGDHYDDTCLFEPNGAAWCANCNGAPCGPNHNPPNENQGVIFPTGDDEWYEDISMIDTTRYYQVRVTFEADIFTGLVPELSAVAVSWIGNE